MLVIIDSNDRLAESISTFKLELHVCSIDGLHCNWRILCCWHPRWNSGLENVGSLCGSLQDYPQPQREDCWPHPYLPSMSRPKTDLAFTQNLRVAATTRNVFRPLEMDAIPTQSLGNSSFINAPNTVNLQRELTSQSSEDLSMLVPAHNGATTILQPRSYQREMLEQSLQRNIIVAVQSLSRPYGSFFSDTTTRWILAVARHKSQFFALLVS